ncbi:VOC family protein [Streptomyces sp. WM6378]|uniref:VOC family protein n=1 Tax=Streptomyces sp. WM6378 TaxID=1415557 RepID=UPI0006AF3D73|nr:VOC family protein [Streptomyces sp. WM6378]KOU49145.1 lyase [Streptomyces sp. WM6378]
MNVFPAEDMEMTRLLVVSDVAASRRWYEQVLGARVDREYESACVLSMLGAWMLLVEGGGPTEDKPTVTMAPPADADQVSAELIFRVRDCRGAYETLRTRGADFLTPPVDRGYEIRAFFRDPDGHLFEISELVA